MVEELSGLCVDGAVRVVGPDADPVVPECPVAWGGEFEAPGGQGADIVGGGPPALWVSA
ncbi:hypothetical protein [Streptomyces odonnellii]|uniref:hypothetical protein n=1 Tax=Streptomyces odonnellii TaxID=1417980 RepID=UPI0012FEF92F|nr:hypothetical protein [Streptomyces odonnellii]